MEAKMFRLIWQEIKFRRGAIIGWGLGLLFFPVVYISLYPSVADEMAGLADLDIYKAMGVNLGTFADWIGSIQIIFLPLVAAIFGITNGTGTLAGEEEDGRLEMLVTLPLPRWMIVTAKAIALNISSFLILLVNAFVTWGIFELIKDQIETEMVGKDLFIAVLSTWPLVFAMSMFAMFLASFCARRRFASIISIGYLILSYFGSNLAASTEVLEPFEPFFLFSYLDQTGPAVISGQQPKDLWVLAGVGVVSFILALIFFQRRRLTVGMWPWQRSKIEG
jgi:ABC-2 type transport system permease protein